MSLHLLRDLEDLWPLLKSSGGFFVCVCYISSASFVVDLGFVSPIASNFLCEFFCLPLIEWTSGIAWANNGVAIVIVNDYSNKKNFIANELIDVRFVIRMKNDGHRRTQ